MMVFKGGIKSPAGWFNVNADPNSFSSIVDGVKIDVVRRMHDLEVGPWGMHSNATLGL